MVEQTVELQGISDTMTLIVILLQSKMLFPEAMQLGRKINIQINKMGTRHHLTTTYFPI